MRIVKESPSAAAAAAALLKRGGVIICPTDTVYGFLADAANKKAVDNIYKIKKRPKGKPLPMFVKNLNMAKALAEISKKQEKTIKKHWPGKYTFILKRRPEGGPRGGALYGVDDKTIALRMPNYPFLNTLLKRINKPLVQTSVNISALEPLKNIEAILQVFGGDKRIGLLIEAGSIRGHSLPPGRRKPSKIIDLTQKNLVILR